MNELERTSRWVKRYRWSHADDRLQTGYCSLHLVRSLDEIVYVPVDFLLSTPWKKCEDRSCVGQSKRSACFLLRWQIADPVKERMSDKGCVDAVTAQQLFLERKDHCSFRHDLRELGQTTLTPRPHLGSDVVQNRNARFARSCRGFHVEARIVDDDKQAHIPTRETALDLVQEREVHGNVPDDFQESHHARLVAGEKLHSRFFHQRAAEPREIKVRPAPPELGGYSCGMEVTGSFSSDEDHFCHGASGLARERGPCPLYLRHDSERNRERALAVLTGHDDRRVSANRRDEAVELETQWLPLRSRQRDVLHEIGDADRTGWRARWIHLLLEPEKISCSCTEIQRHVAALLENPDLSHAIARYPAGCDVRDGP